MTFVVGSPVLHEVCEVLDVDSSAWHDPQTGVLMMTACAGLPLITLALISIVYINSGRPAHSLFKKFATQTGTQLSYFTSLLSLFWS